MGLYGGLDLHGKSTFLGLVDGEGKRVYRKKLPKIILKIIMLQLCNLALFQCGGKSFIQRKTKNSALSSLKI